MASRKASKNVKKRGRSALFYILLLAPALLGTAFASWVHVETANGTIGADLNVGGILKSRIRITDSAFEAYGPDGFIRDGEIVYDPVYRVNFACDYQSLIAENGDFLKVVPEIDYVSETPSLPILDYLSSGTLSGQGRTVAGRLDPTHPLRSKKR